MLLGAVPLFEKTDSHGEFIFDWTWAAALERSGRPYYPKLVAAIPYTPIPGPRLLLAPDAGADTAHELAEAALAFAAERDTSSLHWLFLAPQDLAPLARQNCLVRTGCHFEWENDGAADFTTWLATLTSARRKNIRRERRRIAEAGIKCEWRRGSNLDARELDLIYRLYAANYYAHGMLPYLTPGFFGELVRRMPEALSVCFAQRGSEIIACAIYLEDEHVHFELCYYQGVEYALTNGLARFHPGVQGEHKLLRGFAPTLHYSAHWLRDDDLHQAVASFLERERTAIADYTAEAAGFLPFRRDKG
jgi:predicted N-acyltransferase